MLYKAYIYRISAQILNFQLLLSTLMIVHDYVHTHVYAHTKLGINKEQSGYFLSDDFKIADIIVS